MLPMAIEEITRLLPERAHAFTGSDYPLPVARHSLGTSPLTLRGSTGHCENGRTTTRRPSLPPS